MAIEREIRSALVGVRVSPSLKLALREASKDNRFTIGSMAERILAEWLETNGYLGQTEAVFTTKR